METNIRCNNKNIQKIKLKKNINMDNKYFKNGNISKLFLDKIPQSAAVNESVNLAKNMDIKQAQIL